MPTRKERQNEPAAEAEIPAEAAVAPERNSDPVPQAVVPASAQGQQPKPLQDHVEPASAPKSGFPKRSQIASPATSQG